VGGYRLTGLEGDDHGLADFEVVGRRMVGADSVCLSVRLALKRLNDSVPQRLEQLLAGHCRRFAGSRGAREGRLRAYVLVSGGFGR
jgi:hypothetical protein